MFVFTENAFDSVMYEIARLDWLVVNAHDVSAWVMRVLMRPISCVERCSGLAPRVQNASLSTLARISNPYLINTLEMRSLSPRS